MEFAIIIAAIYSIVTLLVAFAHVETYIDPFQNHVRVTQRGILLNILKGVFWLPHFIGFMLFIMFIGVIEAIVQFWRTPWK